MTTRTFLTPVIKTNNNETNNKKDNLEMNENCLDMDKKYIVLFKNPIELSNLTLKNATVFNNMKLQFLLTSGQKFSDNIVDNNIRGFICCCISSEYEAKINSIIATILETLKINNDNFEYEITLCCEKFMDEALGFKKESMKLQDNELFKSSFKKEKTVRQPTLVDVKKKKKESSMEQTTPSMKKANLRQKYLL